MADETPVIEHRFRVVNTTDRPVQVLGETHSCSCSNVELEPCALGPGEATDLVMRINVGTGYSKRQVGCTVITDHPSHGRWEYTLLYESFPKAQIVPSKIDLGTCRLVADSGTRREGGWLELYSSAADESAAGPMTIVAPSGVRATLDRGGEVDMLGGGIRRTRYRFRVELIPEELSPGYFVVIRVAGC